MIRVKSETIADLSKGWVAPSVGDLLESVKYLWYERCKGRAEAASV